MSVLLLSVCSLMSVSVLILIRLCRFSFCCKTNWVGGGSGSVARKGFVCYRLHLHQERAVERVGIVSTKCDISLPLKAISDELFFFFFLL